MKCLFVREPYAGWIVDGVKDIEYRTRATNIRGKIGIIQSKSGTVIGEVEITGCTYNMEIDLYEWSLAKGKRYAKPIPFKHKNGAVVWIEIDYDPKAQKSAPKLSPAEFKKQRKLYEAD